MFVAAAAEEAITISYSGSFSKCMVKAIQLRELDEETSGGESGSGETGGGESGGEVDPPSVTPEWPSYVPCTPLNRCTVGDPIPVVAQLYQEDYNMLHSGTLPKSFDLVTVGDSITCNWSVRDSSGFNALSPNGYNGVLNLGIGGDRTQHVIWRLEEGGCLENFTTKYFTLMIGVNNSFQPSESNSPFDDPAEIAKGVERIVYDLKTVHPEAKILLMPIIPYERLHDTRGPAVHANDEEVNDIIINLVDNKRVFWVDLRGGFLNTDGTLKDEYYSASGAAGSDGAGHYLHPASLGYQEVFDPAVAAAMAKYAAIPAGTAQETDPSLGYAQASLDGAASKVTMKLVGVYRGTDTSARAATSYSVSYKLDDGAWVTALENQTLTRNSFDIPDVAVGDHTCLVKMTTSAGKTVTVTSAFTMCDAWSAVRLTSDSSFVSTNGALVYAYAQAACKPNGVSFSKLDSTDNSDVTWGITFGYTSSHSAPSGISDSGYSTLLSRGWWIPGATGGSKIPLTLKNLTVGDMYLVQVFAYRSAYNDGTLWIDGTQKDTTFIKAGSGDWTCGGALVGVFTADAATKTFDIMAEGQTALNGFQVRRLGADEHYTPVDPVEPPTPSYRLNIPARDGLELVSVTTNGQAVSAMDGTYPILEGSSVKVTFAAVEGYEIVGDNYVAFTMTGEKTLTVYPTVKEKTSGSGEGGGETTPEEPVAAGWTVTVPTSTDGLLCTTGTLVYAYAPKALTVDGISFTGDETLANTDFTVDQTYSGYDSNMGASSLSGDWANLMRQAWRWSNTIGTLQVTLNGLESGNDYLVQVLSRNGWSNVKIGGGDAEKQSSNGSYGASVVGVFTASGSSQTVAITYGGDAGWRTINAIQVRKLGAGSVSPSDPVDPPAPTVYTLTVPAVANMTLTSVTTNGVAVAADNGAYSIVANTQVEITFEAAEGYEIVSGNPVTITVTANRTLADTEFPVVQEKTSGGGEVTPQEPVVTGWSAEAMGATETSVRTDGTLVYAYARRAVTVNTVPFAAIGDQNLGDVYSRLNFSLDLNLYRDSEADQEDPYQNLIGHYWCNSAGERTLTLKGLTSGKKYLVQVILNMQKSFAAGAKFTVGDDVVAKANGTGWENGGSLTGVFVASGSTESFTLVSSVYTVISALQVRELPASETVTVSPGNTVSCETEAAANAVTIKISDDAAKNAGQASVVKRVVTPNGNKFDVTVEIDENKIVPLDTTVAAFASVGLTDVAKGEGAVEVSLASDKVTSGLYYSIEYADNLAFVGKVESARALATSSGVTISVPKLRAPMQFFRVVASLVRE